MQLQIASATDRGRVREQNEDSVLADGPLVAVADGMGGHRAGEVASSVALEAIKSWKDRLDGTSGPDAAETLKQAFDDANRTVWEKGRQDEELLGMGTTLTAGWIDGGSVTLAHVGDSRAYLLRGGKLQQLTTDQNVAQDLVRRGRISEDEAASSPHRHIILQAIGAEPEGLDIEVASVALRPGDRLVLATDGLFGMVKSPSKIRDILVSNDDPQEACRVLIEEANAAGGEDNISVVIVDTRPSNGETVIATDDDDVRIERSAETKRAPAAVEEPERRKLGRWPIVAGAVAILLIVAGFFITRLGDDTLLVAERGGTVVVMRGKPGASGARATGDVVKVFPEQLDRFPRNVREDLREGIPVGSMREARQVLDDLPRLLGPRDTPKPSASPQPSASPSPGAQEALHLGDAGP